MICNYLWLDVLCHDTTHNSTSLANLPAICVPVNQIISHAVLFMMTHTREYIIEIKVWISNYIHMQRRCVITRARPCFNGSVTKLGLK